MYIIAANWKMNKTSAEAEVFVESLKRTDVAAGREIIIAPPFTLLLTVSRLIAGTFLKLAAQNMCFAESGAFTGEISPGQIKDAGATHVILGHSERRKIFKEDDELIAKKLKAASAHELCPIFCVGETKEERETEQTFSVLETQLTGGLSLLNQEDIKNVIFAYEPVWAIGTGITASPDQAEEAHNFISKFVKKNYFKNSPYSVRILYGGSVTPDNIESLMAQPSISGALVGGASLKLDSFLSIINFKDKEK
jgi:triosephosphate isomerase